MSPGDVLEWCTWGGGGWGDPLERDEELVGKEVRRGLVTREGARAYGVVVDEKGRVDKEGTRVLRGEIRAGRKEGEIIDRGGTLKELFERCEIEVGMISLYCVYGTDFCFSRRD